MQNMRHWKEMPCFRLSLVRCRRLSIHGRIHRMVGAKILPEPAQFA